MGPKSSDRYSYNSEATKDLTSKREGARTTDIEVNKPKSRNIEKHLKLNSDAKEKKKFSSKVFTESMDPMDSCLLGSRTIKE